jgi:hypothetical protein
MTHFFRSSQIVWTAIKNQGLLIFVIVIWQVFYRHNQTKFKIDKPRECCKIMYLVSHLGIIATGPESSLFRGQMQLYCKFPQLNSVLTPWYAKLSPH